MFSKSSPYSVYHYGISILSMLHISTSSISFASLSYSSVGLCYVLWLALGNAESTRLVYIPVSMKDPLFSYNYCTHLLPALQAPFESPLTVGVPSRNSVTGQHISICNSEFKEKPKCIVAVPCEELVETALTSLLSCYNENTRPPFVLVCDFLPPEPFLLFIWGLNSSRYLILSVLRVPQV